MRFFVFASLASLAACAIHHLPDPPKVVVAQDVLHRFQVFGDVNAPGEFSRVISITPSLNSSDPSVREQAKQAKAIATKITEHNLEISFLNSCTRLITVYRPLAEGPLVEFEVAHALNAYTRVFNIIQKVNNDVISDFGNLLRTRDRSAAEHLCKNSEIVQVAAIQATREGDVSIGCRRFLNKAEQNITLIQDFITQGVASNAALHQMNHMLTEDYRSSLNSVINFLKANPVFPKQFLHMFIQAITFAFRDYLEFYNRHVQPSVEVANAIGMPVYEAQHVILQKGMMFVQEYMSSHQH